MSMICTIAATLGLHLASCQAPPSPITVPIGDPAAFAYAARRPPPPQKEIVRETVRVETVYVPTPVPPVDVAAAEPPPIPTGPQPEPVDPRIEEARASSARAYRARRAGRLGEGDKRDWQVSLEPGAATASPGFVAPVDPLSLPAELADLASRDEASRFRAPGLQSGLPVDNERILAADRYITGVLESSINTQVSGDGQGSVVIQTSRDVFGYHGRLILVPKGSRLICAYEGPSKIGETRIAISCGRILSAGVRAEIYQIEAAVRDAQGRAGITGDVDNRFWRRYGTAFLLAGIGATVRGLTAGATNETDSTGEIILDEAGKELAKRFGEITASVLQETVALQPVISIPQGTRVQIRPANDWYIAKPL